MKKCPFCAEEIQEEAVKCRHCGSSMAASASGSPNNLDEHLVELLRAGQKIQAVKLVCERKEIGLAEAKAYVEAISMNTPRATQMAQTRSGPTGLRWVAMFIGAAVLLYAFSLWSGGEKPQTNIGKTAYNSINDAKRGQIVGVENRFGVAVYAIRTDEGAITYAPVDGTDVR